MNTSKTLLPPATILFPLPAVMVSCGNNLNEHNIITISWCGTICSEPPMCYISVRKERHSYEIIKRNKAFVINLVDENLTHSADWCGIHSGSKYQKFKEMKLTPIQHKTIKAPLIAESPVNIECVVKNIIPLGSHDMFIADITAIHAKNSLINKDGKICNLDSLNLISYQYGTYYNKGNKMGDFGFTKARNKL